MFTLDTVVPWGRSFAEYERMFALTEADLARPILGCGDGPASFNAELTRRGGRVVSCDPLYEFTRQQIAQRLDETYDTVLDQTRRNADEFVWGGDIQTPDDLGRVRMAAMQTFLDDYEMGTEQGRYVRAELPHLPFDDKTFDLALCSHFLFLYSDQLGGAFHADAIRELCRVSGEVRIFPLLALGGRRSPFVEMCANDLRTVGRAVAIEKVTYEFQRGGNEMLRITAR